jgi:hypothetical protein
MPTRPFRASAREWARAPRPSGWLWAPARAQEKARDILVQKRLTPTEEPSTLFPEALEQFLDTYRRKNKASTAAETERLLRRHFNFSSDIRAITTRDITRTIDQIKRGIIGLT